jgi:hypothetical protein
LARKQWQKLAAQVSRGARYENGLRIHVSHKSLESLTEPLRSTVEKFPIHHEDLQEPGLKSIFIILG